MSPSISGLDVLIPSGRPGIVRTRANVTVIRVRHCVSISFHCRMPYGCSLKKLLLIYVPGFPRSPQIRYSHSNVLHEGTRVADSATGG